MLSLVVEFLKPTCLNISMKSMVCKSFLGDLCNFDQFCFFLSIRLTITLD